MLIPIRGLVLVESILFGRGHYCGLIFVILRRRCNLKNIYLLRGFGTCPIEAVVLVTCNHWRKARGAYIIIPNIKIGIYKLRRSDILKILIIEDLSAASKKLFLSTFRGLFF